MFLRYVYEDIQYYYSYSIFRTEKDHEIYNSRKNN